MCRNYLRGTLVLLVLILTFLGCEEEPATIKVVNHGNQVVVFSIDGNEKARLQPLTNKSVDIEEGTYKVTLARESGNTLFEQTIHIKSGQYVTYHVQADGTVIAEGGDDDIYT